MLAIVSTVAKYSQRLKWLKFLPLTITNYCTSPLHSFLTSLYSLHDCNGATTLLPGVYPPYVMVCLICLCKNLVFWVTDKYG